MSADIYEEVRAELDERSIRAYPVQEFSATAAAAALVIVGFLQANGIGQIAELIEAIAHRNDGKSLRIKMGDDEFEATGDTHERMAAQLGQLIEKNQEEQDKMRQLGVQPEDDTQ